MAFINDVLHRRVVGIETLNQLSRSIRKVFLLFIFYESQMQNIYQNLPLHLPDECIEILQSNSNVRIERIISQGHSTPIGQWYDQTEHEWVMVLQGLGVIEYADGQCITLNVGDYVYLPAHIKHRVASTIENQHTIWLAIFWS
jgi:cupin 2 domain-containing protein